MHRPNALPDEGDGRALYLVGLTVLLVTFLVAVSAILGRTSSHKGDPPAADGGGGGGGMVHMIPGAPSPIRPEGTFPDGPAYTIVEDIRETMNRLPDRNLPKGWPDPTVEPKPKKPG